jgi:lipopolysaccharide export system permease protein
VTPDARLKAVRIYAFDERYQLRTLSIAEEGRYENGHSWTLFGVTQTSFDGARTRVAKIPELQWSSVLQPNLLAVLLVRPDRMSAWSLYSYSQHLKENRQKARRYEIALWTKLIYPFAVLVMMLLALPFSQFQRRQGGVGARIFTGIMLGLAFNTLNRLFGTLGVLYDWPAPLSALTPTVIFLGLALALMRWQEKR